MQATQTNDQQESGILAQMLGALGPYQMRSVIGEGGMGAVYLADQTSPVQRQVAIKVTRIDLGSVGRLARFESERQILATLKHPHIAQVFDAGQTPEGHPFLVMEYIDGIALDDYASRNKLGIEARLALMMQACTAVIHAHQNGVIHRDLKPDNLIVETVNGSPIVKLIDFGIAKLIEGQGRQHTETGMAIGTPMYMSPEQRRGELDVDIRTDVFSLGLTLYRLLTGRLPQDAKTETTERRSNTLSPPILAPSRFVSHSTTDADIEQEFGLTRAQLCNALRGELDWVVLKATALERQERYGSVSELNAELQRIINHEPVMAVPPSWHYLLRKYIQRHRWQTLSIGVVAGTIGLAILLVFNALQEERKARALADQQLMQHRAFNEFLLHVLTTAKPASPGQAVTLKDVLDHSNRELGTAFKGNPQAQTAMQVLLARIALELPHEVTTSAPLQVEKDSSIDLSNQQPSP